MSLGVSLLVHAVLLLLAGVIYFKVADAGGSGAGAGGGGDIEVALAGDTELRSLSGAGTLEARAPVVGDDTLAETPLGSELGGPSGDESAGLEGGAAGIGASMGGAGAGAVGAGGFGAGGIGGGGASFFGIEARGTRFAYVVDVSGSMGEEKGKLERMKGELTESLRSLLEHMSFQVEFFSSDAHSLSGREKWTEATDSAKRSALALIEKVVAGGGTNPSPGFDAAFKLTPRPDAIYFMTDGLFDAEVADKISMLNRGGKKIPIHCICFYSNESEVTMKRIAKESGGNYTFVERPK